MDVGPSVENPVGSDTEMPLEFDFEDELTEEWPVISLTNLVDGSTEQVINEHALKVLHDLARSFVFLEPDNERMNLDDYDQILVGEPFTAPLHHTPHELDLGESSTVPTVPATIAPVLPVITPLYLERTLIFTPFLEERHRKIYCRRLFNYPNDVRYGVTKMKKKARQREYIHLRKTHGKINQRRYWRGFKSTFEI